MIEMLSTYQATQDHIYLARCDWNTACELCGREILCGELLTQVPAFRTTLPVCLPCSKLNGWVRSVTPAAPVAVQFYSPRVESVRQAHAAGLLCDRETCRRCYGPDA